RCRRRAGDGDEAERGHLQGAAEGLQGVPGGDGAGEGTDLEGVAGRHGRVLGALEDDGAAALLHHLQLGRQGVLADGQRRGDRGGVDGDRGGRAVLRRRQGGVAAAPGAAVGVDGGRPGGDGRRGGGEGESADRE